MARIIEEDDTQDLGSEGERNILLIAYVLHACAVITVVTAVIAVIMNHLKVTDTTSEFVRSHHRWMLRTFWWGLLWFVICSLLVVIAIGLVGYVIVAIWWIYRLVRGFLAFSERRPMPSAG